MSREKIDGEFRFMYAWMAIAVRLLDSFSNRNSQTAENWHQQIFCLT